MSTSNVGLSLVVLRNVPLFSGLEEQELERLSRVAVRRRAGRGDQVVRSGESADALLILLTGRAKVTNFDEEGREIILAWLGPGEFFGEMGLIDGSARSASVVAVENCELLAIGKQEFQRCMQENFQVAQKLMQILVRRLREADRNIESLALLDVYGRVARLLLDLSEEEDGKRLVKKKISKQDMARMIGASREMVSKVMRDLEIGGYIVTNGDQITITGA
ncbi:MAG: cyclic nucleotide-binding domain-containing protein [Dechloromonas sp.]|nr:cyclic nucleotide-binding domain-containing protein [Dechloromonas sp.]